MDSSDSEDYQLYTRTAENIRKQKKLLKLNLTSLASKVSSNSPPSLASKVSSNSPPSLASKVSSNSPPSLACKVSSNSPPLCISSDTDDEVPLSRRINCKTSRKPKKKGTRTLNQTENCKEATIVFDDDHEFNSLPPINFDGGYTRSTDLDKESSDEGESDNNDINFTVEWSGGCSYSHQVFQLKQSDKLAVIFESLAKQVGVPSNRVSLMHNYNPVNPNNTVSSLNLRFYCALTGSVSPTDISYDDLRGNSDGIECGNKIEVKLQRDSNKHILLKISKYQKAKELFLKCAEEFKCEESKLKITFDGESVKPDDIISNLDIEDGDILNVYVKK